MKSIFLLAVCFSAALLPCNAQFNFPLDGSDCIAGRLVDPFSVQTLKAKYPKKYSSKLGYGKELASDTKYRLGTGKLLARHMKSLNAVNQDLQNLLYHQKQSMMMQPLAKPEQSSIFNQQQHLTNLPLSYDSSRSISLTPLVDGHFSAYSQATDQRFQQPACHLIGTQSKQCSSPELQCSCEINGDSDLSDTISQVFSVFMRLLQNIFK